MHVGLGTWRFVTSAQQMASMMLPSQHARRWLGCATMIFAIACASGEGKTVYAGGTLWNGTGASPILDAVIIVADGRIEAAGPPNEVRIPRGARVRRVDGRWIIPGLIDAHAHVERWMLRAFLIHGVTTVRDGGGDEDSITTLRDEVAAGIELGPRLFISGSPIDAAPTRPPAQGIATASEARRSVDARVLIDASQIMLSPKIDRELLRTLMDEANSLLIPVAAHLGKVDALAAAAAGVKAIEYLSGIVEATVANPQRLFIAHEDFFGGWKSSLRGWNGLDSASLERTASVLAASGVALVPTLHYLDAFSHLRNRRYIGTLDLSTVPDDVQRRWDIPGLLRSARLTQRDFADFRRARPLQDLFVRRFHAAGGLIAAGSNAPFPLLAPGTGLHEELARLVAAGLSPREALLAATRDAARLLEADSIGTIEAGRHADFLVLTADPLADIANTRAIEFLVFEGEQYYHEDLEPVR